MGFLFSWVDVINKVITTSNDNVFHLFLSSFEAFETFDGGLLLKLTTNCGRE